MPLGVIHESPIHDWARCGATNLTPLCGGDLHSPRVPEIVPVRPIGLCRFPPEPEFPRPDSFAWIVAIVEFFGGIAMVLGFLVRYAGALMVIEMTITTTRVKMTGGVGFIGTRGTGYELDLLLFAIALTLVLLGPGLLSLDAVLRPRPRLPG